MDERGAGAAPESGDRARLTAWVHGTVQGVGFRWWTRARALELGLVGHATNRPDGRVLVIAEGPRRDCERLLDLLRSGATPGTVDLVVESWSDAAGGLVGFVER
ncbi:acylphosphatase [Rhodococcus olei]|uniref:acylphosphatase n=1 Tax=Rhodococcus olei TaxID=2161675 RepID=A0ABP8P011_9NOCA